MSLADDAVKRVLAINDSCSPLHLRLEPLQVFAVLTAVQEAYRTPGQYPSCKALLETIGRRLQDYLAGFDPEIGRIAELGWRKGE